VVVVGGVGVEGLSRIGDSDDPLAEGQEPMDQRSPKESSPAQDHAGPRVQLRQPLLHFPLLYLIFPSDQQKENGENGKK
jgi:hypothetical protein